MKPQKSSSRIGSLIFSLVLIALVGFAALNRQYLYDQWSLHNYQPPATVSALATQDAMTPSATHIFYVNHPQIQQKTDFNQSCPNNGGEQTIILGCYTPPQRGIYIYNVTDAELDGVQQVTAAHEMLHAAYGRMSSKDKAAVNAMLQDYYDHDLHDKRLLDVMAAYKKSEPNDVVDEMHSIFGTEVANLPPALEDHYKQYFTNRQTVVAFATKYQGAFNSREAQIAQINRQLESLKKSIDAHRAQLTSQASALDVQRQKLQSMLSSGNNSGYNAQVDQFNAQVRAYNSLITQTQAEIKQYNVLVDQANKISTEVNSLNQELSSQPQTQSAQ